MCPPTSSTFGYNIKISNDSNGIDVLTEWSSFWDLKKMYLVEKSPQSMLKIEYLRSLVNECRMKSRFLVVLKHPITLNIATPRHFGWLYHREHPEKSDVLLPMTAKNSFEQIVYCFRYFVKFMTTNSFQSSKSLTFSNNNAKISKPLSEFRQHCKDMGWLPALELFLLQQYHGNEEDIFIDRTVSNYNLNCIDLEHCDIVSRYFRSLLIDKLDTNDQGLLKSVVRPKHDDVRVGIYS